MNNFVTNTACCENRNDYSKRATITTEPRTIALMDEHWQWEPENAVLRKFGLK